MPTVSSSEQETLLLQRIEGGDSSSLGELFLIHQDRLYRMIDLRLDRRVRSRLSVDDVLQESFLDIARRIKEFLVDRTVPFYVWLRFLVIQRLQMLQRSHLGSQKRSVKLESNFSPEENLWASADSMAGNFFSPLTSPTQAAIRHELEAKLQHALASMDALDREVLALRHYEELSNQEVANILQITRDAASKRYMRALKRLKDLFADHPDQFPFPQAH